MIEVTHVRDVLRTIAARWHAQYGSDTIKVQGPKTWQQIHEELLALGPEPTREEVDAVIGFGRSWYSLDCDACDAKNLDVVVDIGQEYDYDSATARVCFACLTKARNLALNAITPEGPEDYGVGSF